MPHKNFSDAENYQGYVYEMQKITYFTRHNLLGNNAHQPTSPYFIQSNVIKLCKRRMFDVF